MTWHPHANRAQDVPVAGGHVGADRVHRRAVPQHGDPAPGGAVRRRHERLRVLQQRQAGAAGDARAAGQRGAGAGDVPDRARAGDHGAPADAAALHQRHRRAERVRHGPQPAQRRGVLHDGHPADPQRAGAARGARPRAVARLQPRHPDLVGGRCDGGGDHRAGQLGACSRACSAGTARAARIRLRCCWFRCWARSRRPW